MAENPPAAAEGFGNKKEALQLSLKGYWQGMKDSNPHKRSQSPVCYLYTNPLRTKVIILLFSKMSTPNFKKIKLFSKRSGKDISLSRIGYFTFPNS